MVNRGEENFIKFPRIAAKLYNKMMGAKATEKQVKEIATYISRNIDSGRLLDIGTGPGKLLLELHSLNPDLELHGLDISEGMIDVAHDNLRGIPVSLRVGRIQECGYDDDYFDLITCTGSFYLWNEPVLGLNEIHRILKQDATAYLFETYSDLDIEEYEKGVKENLRSESFLRKRLMPRFLKQQIDMTYTRQEISDIIADSNFRESYHLYDLVISNLPIWVRIELSKI